MILAHARKPMLQANWRIRSSGEDGAQLLVYYIIDEGMAFDKPTQQLRKP